VTDAVRGRREWSSLSATEPCECRLPDGSPSRSGDDLPDRRSPGSPNSQGADGDTQPGPDGDQRHPGDYRRRRWPPPRTTHHAPTKDTKKSKVTGSHRSSRTTGTTLGAGGPPTTFMTVAGRRSSMKRTRTRRTTSRVPGSTRSDDSPAETRPRHPGECLQTIRAFDTIASPSGLDLDYFRPGRIGRASDSFMFAPTKGVITTTGTSTAMHRV
jgi:hypothetical protein